MRLFDEQDPRPPRSDADWELQRKHRQPHIGPPQDEIGVLALSSFLLARSADVAVAVRGITAHSDGLLLSVVVLFADEQNRDDLAWAMQEYGRSPGRFRLGVVLPDGRRATTGSGDAPPVEQPENEALLTMVSSTPGTLRWQADYWLWPLPPVGPLVVGCHWPDRGIAEALVTVEGGPLVEAAGTCVPVWHHE